MNSILVDEASLFAFTQLIICAADGDAVGRYLVCLFWQWIKKVLKSLLRIRHEA